jgi:hypothetical protein
MVEFVALSDRLANPIDYRHDLQPEEIKISESMLKAFREFALQDPSFKLTPAMLDKKSATHRSATAF